MSPLAQHGPSFLDRREAGRALVEPLASLKLENPLVLALPRGGVPVAREVATALGAELDLLLVRKIGAPGHAEYGLGAVAECSEHPQMVVSEEVLSLVHPPEGYLEAEQARQIEEIERRRLLWRGGREPIPLAGRDCIIVDDGVATGNTARVAIRAARQRGARQVILAVPVAPADVVESLSQEADQFICLRTPEPFIAVSLHYQHFGQLGDEQVLEMLG
ncbi:phosphoribosyltransferase family protein [Devosia sp. ZB163]|uniref:phosphoribosyltransferase n=1 Tax=Devosia sp. ZB163 TaxID=3025938 RepID=UPI002361CD00|nr:phosphoribosyltransferase family protein [Devosia sp. ZB163]MDC9822954.1 phosphoribosyltransferase family protein [Devosia sp. ZB163]